MDCKSWLLSDYCFGMPNIEQPMLIHGTAKKLFTFICSKPGRATGSRPFWNSGIPTTRFIIDQSDKTDFNTYMFNPLSRQCWSKLVTFIYAPTVCLVQADMT